MGRGGVMDPIVPLDWRGHTYKCVVTGCTNTVDCDCDVAPIKQRLNRCDPTRDWLCTDHEGWIRCDYCGEYVAAPALRVGLDAYCPACESYGREAREKHALKVITRGEVYLREMVALTIASINALDAEDAGRYASLAANEAGYIAWVHARLKGEPQLAPISTRDPVSWTDYTRNRPLMP